MLQQVRRKRLNRLRPNGEHVLRVWKKKNSVTSIEYVKRMRFVCKLQLKKKKKWSTNNSLVTVKISDILYLH